MNDTEARAWLKGERSWTNQIQTTGSPEEVGITARADAETMQAAYWYLRARREGLLDEEAPEDDVPRLFLTTVRAMARRAAEEGVRGDWDGLYEWASRLAGVDLDEVPSGRCCDNGDFSESHHCQKQDGAAEDLVKRWPTAPTPGGVPAEFDVVNAWSLRLWGMSYSEVTKALDDHQRGDTASGVAER